MITILNSSDGHDNVYYDRDHFRFCNIDVNLEIPLFVLSHCASRQMDINTIVYWPSTDDATYHYVHETPILSEVHCNHS